MSANRRPPVTRATVTVLQTMLVLGLGSIVACDPNNPTPASNCPTPPAPAATYGQPAARAAGTNVDLELAQRYMRNTVRVALDQHTNLTPMSPTAGVHAGQVLLTQAIEASQQVNLIRVRLTPWIAAAPTAGQTTAPIEAEIQHYFDLTVRIVPFLVNSTTHPDANVRHKILKGADEGIVLQFQFHDLNDVSFGHPVVCPGKDFDIIETQVLKGVYDGLAKQDPIVIPSGSVTALVNSLVGTPVKIVGINLGSDLELKLGFKFNAGVPTPFDSSTVVRRFGDDDWGISIDTTFVNAAVTKAANATLAQKNGRADSVSVTYAKDGLNVVITGTQHGQTCNSDIHFIATTTTVLQVRRAPDSTSVLQANSAKPDVHATDPGSWLCGVFDALFLGSATLVIGGGPPGPPTCPNTIGPPIQFEPTKGDTFYATTVTTDGFFYIAGRSKAIDALLPARPPVPNC